MKKSTSTSTSTSTETLPAVRLGPIDIPSPVNFREASYTVKKRMLSEYKSLPNNAKPGWREAHQASQAIINYYKAKFSGKTYGVRANKALEKRGNAVSRPMKPGAYLDTTTPEMLAEYQALPNIGGHKSAWLKVHGLNHQTIFNVKKHLALKVATNGTSVAAPISRTSTTLDDAINAMKVKRDMLNDFIADLERMRH